MADHPTASTGNGVLDAALQGGVPRDRTVLLTGVPGTGKSTLAMQFLQQGLEEDERCLFLSTEQTKDELRSAFSPFPFALDHPNLTVRTLHAAPGQTFESDEKVPTFKALDESEEVTDQWINIPFTSERIQAYLLAARESRRSRRA